MSATFKGTAKINVTRIDKSALFEGKNGKYLDVAFFENDDGPDQYGNDGYIAQDIGKERRLAGERGEIIGNWKHAPGKQEAQQDRQEQEALTTKNVHDVHGVGAEDDDIPF